MSVPGYQCWYLPLLHLLGDGQVRRMGDVFEQLAEQAGLTEVDRAERLPSGSDLTYRNRISWARTFLKKAGLVHSPARAQVQISAQGQAVLVENPAHIDDQWLRRYPSFVEWQRQSNHRRSVPESGLPSEIVSADGQETPQEALERVHGQLRLELADELLDRVKQSSPAFFEKVVVDLLIAMGYGGSLEDAGRTIGRSGDGGIDGVIKEDRLGLDVIYLQAKRWEGSVGRPVVQAFAGSLEGVRARKGVLITTSGFTAEAKEYVHHIGKKIVLIDGVQLTDYMIQHGVGVGVEVTYTIKRIDNDYFDQG